MTQKHPGPDRRSFLHGALGAAALAGLGGPLLAACGNGGATRDSNTANAKVRLPTQVIYRGVQPDLPRTAAAGNDGFFHYPADPVKAISTPPGKGGSVSAFVQLYSPIPPTESQNRYWQQLNATLHTNLNMSFVSSSDYQTKSSTIIAGGDLPDMMQIYGSVPELPALLAAKFQDLTEFLSGDNVKQFPFLANIPTACWIGSVFNGGIYGLPVPRPLGGSTLYGRQDLLEAKGLNVMPATWAETVENMAAVNDPRHNRWALANPIDMIGFVQQMLGLPNGWKLDGGKLTATNELEGTKQALDALVTLNKKGYIHPDSYANNSSDLAKQWFNAGSCVYIWGSIAAWNGLFDSNIAGSKFKVVGRPAYSFDASTKPVGWGGIPSFSFTALKKASKDRIHELLSIANWLAAPFGTEEYLFRKYGTVNVDFTKQGTDPVLTQKGLIDTGLGINYITDAPYTYYYPHNPAVVRGQHAYEAAYLPTYHKDPTLGLYSDTNSRKGATLGTLLKNAQLAILQGRQPVSSWDDTMKSWRQQGGDQIRQELEKALAGK